MKRIQRIRESTLRGLFFACAALTIVTALGIILVLVTQSLGFFKHAPLWQFLTDTVWAPTTEERFGILPLLCGTLVVALGALAIAIPIGIATAVYLSEYASATVRQVSKPILELLAGVPSVVFGYFAITFITPMLIQPLFPSAGTFNLASAAIVVGIMIIPTICSLCDDALRAVPQTLRHAAHALAATRLEVSTRIVLPAALSGVVAAVLLALARAIGETMAVALAAGLQPNLTLNPLAPAETMTGYIVRISQGDTPAGSIEWYSIYAVGLVLFVITFAINVVAQRVLGRFREAYE